MDWRIRDGEIEIGEGYNYRPMREDERVEVLLQIVIDQDRLLHSLARRVVDLGG